MIISELFVGAFHSTLEFFLETHVIHQCGVRVAEINNRFLKARVASV